VPLADVVVPEEDVAAVADVYRSGWLSMGPQTEAFEHDFAAYAGARHAIAVTNGTAALHLMCAAAGLGSGDEVIVPSMTFVATVNAVAYTGAAPVFADIVGPTRPWLDPAAVAALITARTKAILTMAYGGHPGAIEALAALARDRGLLLLEDAAHAAGSRLHDRHLGTFGRAGAFSFFSNKNLAVGEGGMVVTDDDDLARRVRLLRSHGMTTLTWDRHRGHASAYDVVALGFNYRIDEPRAALARRRLARLDADNARRGELDRRYRELLSALDGLTCVLPPTPGARPAHHLFAIVLSEGIDRAGFRTALAARGIQTSVHYPPVHRFSIYDGREPLRVTEDYGAREVTLPMFATMTTEQQDLVIAAIREIT
jgi:dTDP-4-amino-4,6-dideoxygalactose transaminase